MRRQEIHPEDCGVRDCMECDSGEILLGGLPFRSEIEEPPIPHLWLFLTPSLWGAYE